MPLSVCQVKGKAGFKWGASGKCYAGAAGKARALRQARAIEASRARAVQNARARRLVGNAFCPTGEGGGVDPSCSPGGLSIREDVRASHSGQVDLTARAFTSDGQQAAYLDYSVFEGRPHISMVESQQKGLRAGEKLIEKLAEEYGYENIDWGMMTPDGVKLQERLDKKHGIQRGIEKTDVEKVVKEHGGMVLSLEDRGAGVQSVYAEFSKPGAGEKFVATLEKLGACLLYTSPSPRD